MLVRFDGIRVKNQQLQAKKSLLTPQQSRVLSQFYFYNFSELEEEKVATRIENVLHNWIQMKMISSRKK